MSQFRRLDNRSSGMLDLAEIWRYRDLLGVLLSRDLTARYRPTLLGPLWAVIQPIATTAVLSLFLGRLVGIPSDGYPYAAFVLMGLLPWSVFATGVSRAAGSLVSNSPLVTRTFFPLIYLPASAVASTFADLVFSMPAVIVVFAVCDTKPSLWLAVSVLSIGIAAVLSLGVGLVIAALATRLRDLLHALPFLLQLAMFATPVVYPASLVPESHRRWLAFNPMAAVLEETRNAALGRSADAGALLVAGATSLVVLILGLLVFGLVSRVAADRL